MTALYVGAGAVVALLLGYLLAALVKPEIFP
ncbi:MAG: potassium-transporting ATPase subunit F [Asticcacaulis sp.]|nr:potassium-transporting ATPase subunit F [Asticcacaulis sp.]